MAYFRHFWTNIFIDTVKMSNIIDYKKIINVSIALYKVCSATTLPPASLTSLVDLKKNIKNFLSKFTNLKIQKYSIKCLINFYWSIYDMILDQFKDNVYFLEVC